MRFEVFPFLMCQVASVNCDEMVANITAWFLIKICGLLRRFVSSPCDLKFALVLGPKRRQCSPFCGGLDGHGDHPLLFLHLQPAQPSALPHQMGKVKLLRISLLVFYF